MAIAQDTFNDLIGQLAIHYRRPLTEFVKQIWYEELSRCLTEDEFVSAVRRAVCKHREMPLPHELILIAKGRGLYKETPQKINYLSNR